MNESYILYRSYIYSLSSDIAAVKFLFVLNWVTFRYDFPSSVSWSLNFITLNNLPFMNEGQVWLFPYYVNVWFIIYATERKSERHPPSSPAVGPKLTWRYLLYFFIIFNFQALNQYIYHKNNSSLCYDMLVLSNFISWVIECCWLLIKILFYT